MLSLLITLDCVRADHVGGPLGLTPRLDSLAEEWTTFAEAFAQSQNTLSSHLSLLTSNYLFQHGAYSNFVKKSLPAHALTRRLAERGFDTRAFASIEFLALLLGNQAGEPDPRFPPPEDRSLSARFKRRFVGSRRRAADTLRAGFRWLAAPERARDTFLWLHLFDAHMVYDAPRAFLDRHVPEAEAEATAREQLGEKDWFSPDFPEYSWRVPLDHFPRRYAAAVAYQDASLGDFFSALKAKGWWEDALVVLTADHGECLLGDHNVYCAHKKLFDTTVQVPMRVRFPGGRHAGEHVDALVQHVDVAPTIAAAAGTGDPLYLGHDLAGVAAGKLSGHPFAFSEHVDNFLRAARDREWIYVEGVSGSENKWGLKMEEGNLFRRDASPAPLEAHPHAQRLKSALDALLVARPDVSSSWGAATDTDAEVAERLRGLGYM